MKNVEYSNLYREYQAQVVEYKAHNERIIQSKFAMSKFWNYKNDYPQSWRDTAEKLAADRKKVENIKMLIRATKFKMRKCNSEYNQK